MEQPTAVDQVRNISWNIFGDEDLIFFIVFLGMPGILAIAYLCHRIYRINARFQYATEYEPTRHELDVAELNLSSDEDDTLSFEEMMAATRDMIAEEEAATETMRQRRVRQYKTKG